MTLQAAITEATGSHTEVLAAVKARTITKVGALTGAQLQQLMIPARLVALVKDTAADTANQTVFRDICDSVKDRIASGAGIDLADQSNSNFLSAFFANSEVQDRIAASTTYGTVQAFQGAMINAASAQVQEFPSVALHDVIAVKEPALAVQQESAPVTVKGISQVLRLTTAAALPETTQLKAEISHDGVVWQPVQTSGLESVAGAGLYVFRVMPGPVFITESQIRVVSPYSVGLTLA